MLDFPKWKIWTISLTIFLGVLFALPSLISDSHLEKRWPSWLPNAKINYGLDLAGGSHLLYEADLNDAIKQRLATQEEAISTELRRDPRIEIGDVSTAGAQLTFIVRDPRQRDAAVERVRTLTQGVGLNGTRDWEVRQLDSSRVAVIPTEGGTRTFLKDRLVVAREVVRRRIDPQGTKEAAVMNQGERRIMVQVPGESDPEALKDLIGQTARLEFKLVDLTADQNVVQQGRAPPGSETLPMIESGGYIAVKRRTIVSGENLTQAAQSFDENGNPAISFTFDTPGARRFGRVTQENIGKPFAIILDNRVLSAPTIQSAILGGQGRITGNFTVESANQLAIALSSGSLPVKLNIIEERTVGPELGKDSIRKGAIASLVATAAVILFMLVTYGRFGVYATLALIINALLILGIMAMFNATLTLPGIAGFVLTIGAAVDANVLINERIREEQRRGRKTLETLERGYAEASTAIFDANITNIIAAALMWYFGSGPIKGFAVVLMIGIVTSVFTAVNFTRMLVALWVKRTRPRTLHI